MIQDAILQAQRMHRKMIEGAYDGSCSVYERQPVFDPDTKVTGSMEVEVFHDEPCHISFSSVPATAKGETAAAVQQAIKLFLAPEKEIRPGSKIVVSQQGRTGTYSRSGKAAVYSSHQEIVLELFEGYA